MISVEEAKSIILDSLKNFKSHHKLPILNALHQTLDEDIYSKINIPSFPTSTRDGYGWNTKWDKNSKIKCNKKSNYAGISTNCEFNPENSMYISTGGVVPEIFDSVIMIEDVIENENGEIELIKSKIIKNGQYIREVGSDVSKDELVIKKDTVLNSVHISLLASIGVRYVTIKKKVLNIGVLSTGNEVKDVFETEYLSTENGQIYDSNRYMILNRCKEISLTQLKDDCILNVIDLGIIKDDKDELESKVLEYYNKYNLDIIISTGGASVGRKDYTFDIAKSLGKIYITKVNMMPGKPLLFSNNINIRSEDRYKYFFGLAGNPVSSGVQFELFILPFIQSYFNSYESFSSCDCELTFDAKSNDTIRPEYQRVKIIKRNGIYYADSTGKQSSSTLKSLVDANGLLCIPGGQIFLKGSKVNCIIIQSIKEEEINTNTELKIKDGCKIGILTCSDRAYKGIYDDLSGKAIEEYILKHFITNHEIVYKCIPDEKEDCKNAILEFVEQGCGLVLTTGGTGPSKRDITSIICKTLFDKELPGFGEQMRNMSLKYVPTAILSGQTAGVIYSKNNEYGSLIINLPGSPNSIKECLDVVKEAIPYGVELCGGGYVEIDPPAFRGKRVKK